MRALTVPAYGGSDVLQWTDLPEPSPARGEVLLRVHATAVNWSDILEREGRYPGGPQPTFVSGHDVVGKVVARGDCATKFEIGDRVFGSLVRGGGAAELAVAPEAWLHPAPPSVPDLEAAGASSPWLTAEAAVTTMGRLAKGETVLVHAAAGGFGSAVVQLCRIYGAGMIIGTAGGPEKLQRVRDFGADIAVDYLKDDFVAAVDAATEGHGVDLIIDSVGGDVLGASFDCIAATGRMICVGATEGKSTNRFRLQTLFDKGISVGGFTLGHWIDSRPDLMAPLVERVLDLLGRRVVTTPIGGVFEADQATEAHRFLEQRHSVGRTVIVVAPDLIDRSTQ